jgi:hypothetical protein
VGVDTDTTIVITQTQAIKMSTDGIVSGVSLKTKVYSLLLSCFYTLLAPFAVLTNSYSRLCLNICSICFTFTLSAGIAAECKQQHMPDNPRQRQLLTQSTVNVTHVVRRRTKELMPAIAVAALVQVKASDCATWDKTDKAT